MAAAQPVRRLLQEAGIAVSATIRLAGDPVAETRAELAGGGFDAILAGWAPSEPALRSLADLAGADLADLLVLAGPPLEPTSLPAAAATRPVRVDPTTGDPAAVTEHAARWARHLAAPVAVVAGGRATRTALEQLQRAGYRTTEPADTEPPVLSVQQLTVDEKGLTAATIAAAASATTPLVLVAGRQGERPPLHERVPLPAAAERG
jgi:hypothetical protein